MIPAKNTGRQSTTVVTMVFIHSDGKNNSRGGIAQETAPQKKSPQYAALTESRGNAPTVKFASTISSSSIAKRQSSSLPR